MKRDGVIGGRESGTGTGRYRSAWSHALESSGVVGLLFSSSVPSAIPSLGKPLCQQFAGTVSEPARPERDFGFGKVLLQETQGSWRMAYVADIHALPGTAEKDARRLGGGQPAAVQRTGRDKHMPAAHGFGGDHSCHLLIAMTRFCLCNFVVGRVVRTSTDLPSSTFVSLHYCRGSGWCCRGGLVLSRVSLVLLRATGTAIPVFRLLVFAAHAVIPIDKRAVRVVAPCPNVQFEERGDGVAVWRVYELEGLAL